jgi:pimeloyl-ACP methyl ester carboxylesterase
LHIIHNGGHFFPLSHAQAVRALLVEFWSGGSVQAR